LKYRKMKTWKSIFIFFIWNKNKLSNLYSFFENWWYFRKT